MVIPRSWVRIAAKATSLKYEGWPFWPLKGEVHRRVKAAKTMRASAAHTDFPGMYRRRTGLRDEEAQGDFVGCSSSRSFSRIRHS
jgi:hypothetical protein